MVRENLVHLTRECRGSILFNGGMTNWMKKLEWQSLD